MLCPKEMGLAYCFAFYGVFLAALVVLDTRFYIYIMALLYTYMSNWRSFHDFGLYLQKIKKYFFPKKIKEKELTVTLTAYFII